MTVGKQNFFLILGIIVAIGLLGVMISSRNFSLANILVVVALIVIVGGIIYIRVTRNS